MTDSGRAVRPPQQRRSRESYERMLEAAHVLLEENGFDGFTVQEVALRSGVSVGALYERFGNKETLLRSVHARLMAVMTREADAAAARVDAQQDSAAAIGAAVAGVAVVMRQNRKALRVFMHLGAVDEVISAHGSESSIAQSMGFRRSLMPYVSEFRHPDPNVAVDVSFRLTHSTLARQIMYGPVFESDRRLSWKRLVEELSAVCVAYLTCG